MAKLNYTYAKTPDESVTGFINPGNYTLETLKSAMIEDFESRRLKEESVPLKFLPSHSIGGKFLVRSQPNISVTFDSALADFLGLDTPEIEGLGAGVIKLKSPEAYYIYCDSVNAETNLLDNKPSHLLARFDIKSKLFEIVSYPVQGQAPLKRASKP